MIYCPKCKSRLSEDDLPYLNVTGVCAGCVNFDAPNGKYKTLWSASFQQKTRKDQTHVVFIQDGYTRRYITDTGNTTARQLARRFTEKQARAKVLRFNLEAGVRKYFCERY